MGHYASEMGPDHREVEQLKSGKARLKKSIDKIENLDYLAKVEEVLDNVDHLIAISRLFKRLSK